MWNFLQGILLGSCLLLLAGGAKAGHENVPILSDATPVRSGVCNITTETHTFVVQCEQYVKADGTVYLALYLNGKIAVVRKVEGDGSIGAVVWSRDEQPTKPLVDERGA